MHWYAIKRVHISMGHCVRYFTYKCLSLRLILIEVSCRSLVCAVLCMLLMISGARIIRTKQRIINRSFRKENIEDLDSCMRVPSPHVESREPW